MNGWMSAFIAFFSASISVVQSAPPRPRPPAAVMHDGKNWLKTHPSVLILIGAVHMHACVPVGVEEEEEEEEEWTLK